MTGITSLGDKDRIFTNLYGYQDSGLKAAQAIIDQYDIDAIVSHEEIDRYVARDRPVNSAGGFKAEALGITLFERVESEDPTALIGLPLIWLSGALRRAGFQLP